MSIFTHETVTSRHVTGMWASLGKTMHLWRERYRSRHELTQWTDRDMHDAGISWCDIVHEAEKPFWRA